MEKYLLSLLPARLKSNYLNSTLLIVGHKEKNFDIDLRYGNDGEGIVLSLLNGGKKVEVKTDRMAHKTGNIAVEYQYKGYPSGISKTEADYWAFVLNENKIVLLIQTEELKRIGREYFKKGKVVNGGDDNNSKMILIPLVELVKFKVH